METAVPEAPTIPAALHATAERDRGGYVFHLDEGVVRLPYAELAERAERAARRLTALGVAPGDAIGVLGPNRPEWVVWAFATWRAGATLVPVQIPLRIREPAAFAVHLKAIVAAAGCRLVLADRRLVGLVDGGVAIDWEEEGEASGETPAGPANEDAAAVIQFTSGSTSAPKGALLTHTAVMAQMEILRLGYRYEDGTPRSVLGWTPFFHDLGLFANLVHPAYAGSTMHHLPTERFAHDPVEWLRLIDAERPAGTIAPSSAFGHAFRLASRRGEKIDLSSLEGAYFAAEGVDPDVVQRMIEMGRGFGLHPDKLASTYGLAESVMAASYPPVGSGMRVDRVSVEELVKAGAAVPEEGDRSRAVISCGRPLMELRIMGAEGEMPERQVGEIQLRGPSLMSRYVGRNAPDPFVDDGWLRTDDLGYLAEGELFPTGRAKDMVIVMGHNYYPEDFEWAAARTDGVRPGRCVAFNLPDSERVVVLVEAVTDAAADGLEREVRHSVANVVGASPDRVVILPPGTVQKTTSGKLRRAAMRDAYLSGTLNAGPGPR